MSDFEFEKRSQRYRWKDTKRYLSNELVTNLREKAIEQTQVNIESLTESMLSGDITVDKWERDFAQNIKTRTIQLYQLGKPGEIDASDRGKLGNEIRFQYDKLWRFRNEIIDGKLSEKQIKFRTRMYLDKTIWAHEEGKRRSHYKAGYIWERRTRNAKDSCVECIGYAAMGWQPFNSLPAVTKNCSCMSQCKCSFKFSDSIVMPSRDVNTILLQLKNSWLTNNKMKITFETPEIEADDKKINSAIEQAEQAFIKALTEEKETEEVERSPLNFDERPRDDESRKGTREFGHPTPEQLEKMNRFRPKGAEKYKSQNVVSVAYSASNNFVHQGNSAWSINALRNMAQQMPGRPFTANHDWYEVDRVQGLIYDAEVTISDRVSEAIVSQIDRDHNLAILQADGYAELILYVMFEHDSQTVKDIYYRRKGDVSTGGFVDTSKYYCPLDGSRFGDGDSFCECAEGHLLPHPMLQIWFYDDEELEKCAPYYIMDVVTESVETSHVLVGALPAAKIISNE